MGVLLGVAAAFAVLYFFSQSNNGAGISQSISSFLSNLKMPSASAPSSAAPASAPAPCVTCGAPSATYSPAPAHVITLSPGSLSGGIMNTLQRIGVTVRNLIPAGSPSAPVPNFPGPQVVARIPSAPVFQQVQSLPAVQTIHPVVSPTSLAGAQSTIERAMAVRRQIL